MSGRWSADAAINRCPVDAWHGRAWRIHRQWSAGDGSGRLTAVVDCRDTALRGMSSDALLHDLDYSVSQQPGGAAVAAGLEGMLVPSATTLGDNLIVFMARLREGSRLEVVRNRDPRLYAGRG